MITLKTGKKTASLNRLTWLARRLASGLCPKEERLIWIDCEMTGLDVCRHTLVEIACIITEADLTARFLPYSLIVAEGPDIVISQPESSLASMNSWCMTTFTKNGLLQRIRESNVSMKDAESQIVAEGPDIVISQPESSLASMNSWCMTTFTKNGLLQRIRESNVSMKDAESQVVAFVKEHTDEGVCALAGNTVYMDRLFIERYMPDLAKHFHYRVVDVSSFKEVVRRWYPREYTMIPQKKQNHRALDDIRESIEELRWYRANVFK
ncbi:Oligoribonuclease, mitochondrial [Toxocara canis]|uniref:Oligoribonuclease, mitochondrial n=1 Tax=Toxocara canis TaxID=6265 RepID=A0A0B2VDP9_TOXCA|nr:Oligoribonuclease, mitochondrial [Toxocara canis]